MPILFYGYFCPLKQINKNQKFRIRILRNLCFVKKVDKHRQFVLVPFFWIVLKTNKFQKIQIFQLVRSILVWRAALKYGAFYGQTNDPKWLLWLQERLRKSVQKNIIVKAKSNLQSKSRCFIFFDKINLKIIATFR